MYSCIILRRPHLIFFFFFNDTATTEIYTLSLHDALPIFGEPKPKRHIGHGRDRDERRDRHHNPKPNGRARRLGRRRGSRRQWTTTPRVAEPPRLLRTEPLCGRGSLVWRLRKLHELA